MEHTVHEKNKLFAPIMRTYDVHTIHAFPVHSAFNASNSIALFPLLSDAARGHTEI